MKLAARVRKLFTRKPAPFIRQPVYQFGFEGTPARFTASQRAEYVRLCDEAQRAFTNSILSRNDIGWAIQDNDPDCDLPAMRDYAEACEQTWVDAHAAAVEYRAAH